MENFHAITSLQSRAMVYRQHKKAQRFFAPDIPTGVFRRRLKTAS
jgi:hypothetical protein